MRYVYALGTVISFVALIFFIEHADKIQSDLAQPWHKSPSQQAIIKPDLRKASLLLQRYKLFWQKHKNARISHNDSAEWELFISNWNSKAMTIRDKREFIDDAKRLGIMPFNGNIATSDFDAFESFINSH